MKEKKKKTQNTALDVERNDEKGKKISDMRPWEWGKESEGYSRFQRGWAWESLNKAERQRARESLISEIEVWDDRWECLGGIWILSTVWNKSRTGSL